MNLNEKPRQEAGVSSCFGQEDQVFCGLFLAFTTFAFHRIYLPF